MVKSPHELRGFASLRDSDSQESLSSYSEEEPRSPVIDALQAYFDSIKKKHELWEETTEAILNKEEVA